MCRNEGRRRIQTEQINSQIKEKIQIFSKGKVKGYEAQQLEPWQRRNTALGNEAGEVVEENEQEEEYYFCFIIDLNFFF